MKDENGVSKGFGFVCFSNSTEAGKAVLNLNGKKGLTVCEAKTKEKRL